MGHYLSCDLLDIFHFDNVLRMNNISFADIF